MANLRQHPRITDTRDLLASLRTIDLPRTDGRVLNLSQGGMLVAGTKFKVGEVTDFELTGPGFRYAGVANVAHTTDGATGLRFLSWQGQADRPVRALIDNRSGNREAGFTDPRARGRRGARRVVVLIGTDRSSDGPADRPPAA